MLVKFVVKRFEMPKSISTLQNQIDGCERKIKESLAQCAELVEDWNFEFCFSLGTFVNEITTINLDDELDNMKKVQELFKECEKIVATEKKRRNYTSELRRKFTDRERKETVKRLTMQNSFKKKALPYRIPAPPSSQEAIDDQD